MSETEVSVPKKRGRPSLKALEPANMNSSISDNEVSVIVSPKRGRPAKSAVESNDEVSVKRGRGRPPKNGSAVKKAAVPARSVGRPVKQTNVKASGENKAVEVGPPVVKRGRGRPPKNGISAVPKVVPKVGRGRGRPSKKEIAARKKAVPVVEAAEEDSEEEQEMREEGASIEDNDSDIKDDEYIEGAACASTTSYLALAPAPVKRGRPSKKGVAARKAVPSVRGVGRPPKRKHWNVGRTRAPVVEAEAAIEEVEIEMGVDVPIAFIRIEDYDSQDELRSMSTEE